MNKADRSTPNDAGQGYGYRRRPKPLFSCLDFALEVEKITSVKKDNLILNVDGTMAAVLVDIGFPVDSLNGFFILSRTIGLIGHWVDQKRQDSRLIRLFDYLVNYAAPKRREVPPLK